MSVGVGLWLELLRIVGFGWAYRTAGLSSELACDAEVGVVVGRRRRALDSYGI